MRNHPDQTDGASGPALSNAPQTGLPYSTPTAAQQPELAEADVADVQPMQIDPPGSGRNLAVAPCSTAPPVHHAAVASDQPVQQQPARGSIATHMDLESFLRDLGEARDACNKLPFDDALRYKIATELDRIEAAPPLERMLVTKPLIEGWRTLVRRQKDPSMSTACAPPRGAALRHLAPPPTRTRAPSPALATRLHGTERILRALVPCCRAYCTLDAKLSDVILFAAPLSAPAAARAARAPPLLRSNTLNFKALQIRVGA